MAEPNICIKLIKCISLILWDLPTILLPVTIGGILCLSVYTFIKRDFKRFVPLYTVLFILEVLGIIFYRIEAVNFVIVKDFKDLWFYYFYILLFTIIGIVGFIKKDSRYHIIPTLLFILFGIGSLYYFSG